MLRILRAATSVLVLLAACGGESSTGPSAAPAAIKVVSGNNQTGTVGAALAQPLSVNVTAADGKPVSGATVAWDVSPGNGTTSSASSRTDGNGNASVTWTLGTNAGTARVTAQVGGVTPAAFLATAQPGAASVVVALPDTLFIGVGDTVTVASSARDQFGNEVTGTTPTYTSLTGTVATVNSSGLVSAVAQGTSRIVVAFGARSDTVPVTVGAAGSSQCGGLAPTAMTVGQVLTVSGRVCLQAGASSAEYGLVSFASSTVFGTTTAFDVYGMGLLLPTAPIVAGTLAGDGIAAAVSGGFDIASLNALPPVDRQVERERRAIEVKELTPLVGVAREVYADRESDNALAFPKTAKLLAVPNVGDVLTLNSQALQGCSNATNVRGVVKAVGTRSIVVADPDNPAGGYVDADYQSVAATFDTLVYPLDVANFGAPTDIGGTGRVILFFTTAVNRLTPANAGYVVGGFFFARDLYPKTARNGLPACGGSNEAEIFYLLVPDPNGTINGNRRTIADVTRLNLTTVAHEFQHLINASRRLYVNSGAVANEETWLDEGLSHIAEELLYYRISGFNSRSNIDYGMLSATTTQTTNFTQLMTQNFGRMYENLRNPEVTSPYAPNDSLSTRGAIWNFLRYAAGQQADAAAEAAFFFSLVNSKSAGVMNLTTVMPGGQFQTLLNDWSMAKFADDYSQLPQAQLAARYKFPSWNFRSIFPNLRIGSGTLNTYPLTVRTLRSNQSQRVSLAGGGASYFRFATAANRNGLVSLTTNGAAPASSLRFSIVRLR
ncbi:MAG: Ig-like domain-containing protein [Gemmatimonas sp.]